jgi:hypothetical protein
MGKAELDTDLMKTRIDTLGMSSRTTKALANANIRTLGGSAAKRSPTSWTRGLGAKACRRSRNFGTAWYNT